MTIGGGVALLLGAIIGKALKTVADALKPLPFPGPKGVPVFGVVFELDPNTALMRLCDWAKQFGGTYAFRVFSTTFVVIKDSKTIKQILKDSNKGVFMRQMNTLSLLPKSGIFLTDGDAWKYNRRTVDPIIAEPNVRGMVPVMGQMSRRLVNVVSALADSSGNIHNWEPHKLLQLAALDFTVATHFGKDYNLLSPLDPNGSAERENVHKTFQNFLEGFDFILKHIQLGPFIQNRYPFKLNKDVTKFYSAVDNVEKYSKEIIARRQEELKKGATPECNILDKLIFMGKQDLIWNLVTFTLSGGSSVPSTIEWFLYLMCVHPDAQKKARAEVDALGKDPTDNDDLDKLRYVEACVLETLRMNNSTPGPLPYVTVAPYVIEGKEVDVGTVVTLMTGEAMKGEDEGGPEFKPEAWFLPGTRDIDRQRSRNHWAFTGSPRKCPGQYLAMKECVVMAATLLRHFDDFHFTVGYDDVGETTYINRIPVNLRLSMKARQC
ncbi:hypothetical protein FOZ61_004120 [Perkinsus olseni]|uniref:Cytochrome P450 n=1 Tax=Perkinsus olseni TaxID=32597 RepID=A0A7J6M0F7_PEROL|nr:hypothetical protein FOZ61_004120 [Perkinsus olseni]KAF4664975.1 hypothetical protein FOL46_003946 [Perkinsus olseni]